MIFITQMKLFNYFCCLSFICLDLISFPCLSKAGFDEVPDDAIKNMVGFLDQNSWISLLQVSQKYNKLVPQGVPTIRVNRDTLVDLSAAKIIANLRASLLKNVPQGEKHQALESLDLYHLDLTDEGLTELVAFIQESFPNIKKLNLAYNNIGDAGAASLKELRELQILDLGLNKIGDTGVASLKQLQKLKELDLSDNEIRLTGGASFKELPELQKLNLHGNNIGDAGAASFEGMAELKELTLIGCGIGDAGVESLKGLPKLQVLDLSNNEIRLTGGASFKELPELQKLNLFANKIRDVGAASFEGMAQLKVLDLKANPIRRASIKALRQTLVDCQIVAD